MKLGIFGPGLGALYVSAEIARLQPDLGFVHLADVTNNPYGSRPAGEIKELVKGALRALKELGCDVAAIACNTSSIQLEEALRELRPVEKPTQAISLVNVTVNELTQSPDRSGLLILGTVATISGEVFSDRLDCGASDIDVQEHAIPGLVELIDENAPRDNMLAVIKRGLVNGSVDWTRVERVGLFCTHFPIVREVISQVCNAAAGKELKVIAQADFLATRLGESSQLDRERNPGRQVIATDVDPIFEGAAARLFAGRQVKILEAGLMLHPRALYPSQ